MAKSAHPTPTEYGEQLAERSATPLTDEQVEAAARILASVETDQEQHTRVA